MEETLHAAQPRGHSYVPGHGYVPSGRGPRNYNFSFLAPRKTRIPPCPSIATACLIGSAVFN